MTRFFLASALALTGALGFANKADAQYAYGYQTYLPGAGAFVGNRTYASPFALRSTTNYYSPFTGIGSRQSFYSNAWGNNGYSYRTYTPYGNYGYSSGYNPYMYNNYNSSLYRTGYLHRARYVR